MKRALLLALITCLCGCASRSIAICGFGPDALEGSRLAIAVLAGEHYVRNHAWPTSREQLEEVMPGDEKSGVFAPITKLEFTPIDDSLIIGYAVKSGTTFGEGSITLHPGESVQEIFASREEKPNKAPEPTPTSVTPPASERRSE